jgi:hypothetical protein
VTKAISFGSLCFQLTLDCLRFFGWGASVIGFDLFDALCAPLLRGASGVEAVMFVGKSGMEKPIGMGFLEWLGAAWRNVASDMAI